MCTGLSLHRPQISKPSVSGEFCWRSSSGQAMETAVIDGRLGVPSPIKKSGDVLRVFGVAGLAVFLAVSNQEQKAPANPLGSWAQPRRWRLMA
jgi:hypothetical protein